MLKKKVKHADSSTKTDNIIKRVISKGSRELDKIRAIDDDYIRLKKYIKFFNLAFGSHAETYKMYDIYDGQLSIIQRQGITDTTSERAQMVYRILVWVYREVLNKKFKHNWAEGYIQMPAKSWWKL